MTPQARPPGAEPAGAGRQSSGRRAGVRRFAIHYLEMVAAMVLGMMTLYPGWLVSTSSLAESSWARMAEVDLLAMAVAMTLPMVAWMRHRGHGAQSTLEMTLAMIAGFVVLYPLMWARAITATTVTELGHVLMLLFMLVAMLCRRAEYASCAR